MIRLFDLEDQTREPHGRAFTSSAELVNLLAELRDRSPFICELVGESRYKLTIGIGGEFGFVQHDPMERGSPYFMALAPELKEAAGGIEFACGGEPTPIPRRYCLPFSMLARTVLDFWDSGQQSAMVAWEEI